MNQTNYQFKKLLKTIGKKGCHEILLQLRQGSKRWIQLEKILRDKQALSYRIKELLNLGLIEVTIIHDTPTGSKAYQLTPLGKKIVQHIEEMEKEFEDYHKGLPEGKRFVDEVMEG